MMHVQSCCFVCFFFLPFSSLLLLSLLKLSIVVIQNLCYHGNVMSHSPLYKLFSLTHLPLNCHNHVRGFMSLLSLVMSSVMSRTTLSPNLCRVKRFFKPYQNEYNSVKGVAEKGKNHATLTQQFQ